MTITDTQRKAIYSENCAKVFCNILTLSHSGFQASFFFVDNNQDIGDYCARGFDFVPPAPGAEDAEATITIDDTDRILAEAFQTITSKAVKASIALICADDPASPIDGPYEYKVVSFSKKSSSGQAVLSLQRLATLDCNASFMRYTATTFPGLYG